MAKILIITAAQRSGTTTLGAALGASGFFKYFGEIFHEKPNWPLSFYDWARERSLPWHEVFAWNGAKRTFDQYIDAIEAASSGTPPLLDIKLNSWLTLHPAWAMPHQHPFLIHQMCGRGAAFLSIRRRDLAEQFASELIAREVGKWHDQVGADVEDVRIRVDMSQAAEHMRRTILAERLIRRAIGASGAPYLFIDYEDLYPEGQIAPSVRNFLAQHFAAELVKEPLEPPIAKNEGTKCELIENYGELVSLADAMIKALER
jgi:hypothetical protein